MCTLLSDASMPPDMGKPSTIGCSLTMARRLCLSVPKPGPSLGPRGGEKSHSSLFFRSCFHQSHPLPFLYYSPWPPAFPIHPSVFPHVYIVVPVCLVLIPTVSVVLVRGLPLQFTCLPACFTCFWLDSSLMLSVPCLQGHFLAF